MLALQEAWKVLFDSAVVVLQNDATFLQDLRSRLFVLFALSVLFVFFVCLVCVFLFVCVVRFVRVDWFVFLLQEQCRARLMLSILEPDIEAAEEARLFVCFVWLLVCFCVFVCLFVLFRPSRMP